jgi:polysaccharide export outer membrane protein
LQSEVLEKSSAKSPELATYAVTRDFLPRVAGWPIAGSVQSASWLKSNGGSEGQIIAPGDTIDLVIWESGDNGLLAGPGQRGTPLKTSLVSPQGNLFVPYVGPVKVSGMSPERARELVQTKLEPLVPSPQVQLNATPGLQNSVDLVGGVASPGNFPMLDRSLTVLGLLSRAGGAQASIENPQISLHRGGKVYRNSLERVLADPSLDTTLRAGDKVIVEKDKRQFIALGATGSQKLVPFPKDHVSALEAISLAGGLTASRADPGGVLILREYTPSQVVGGTDAGITGPANTRVVFTIDLTSADGLFSAGKFDVQPQDLVLATESPISDARSILSLLGLSFGVANSASNATD